MSSFAEHTTATQLAWHSQRNNARSRLHTEKQFDTESDRQRLRGLPLLEPVPPDSIGRRACSSAVAHHCVHPWRRILCGQPQSCGCRTTALHGHRSRGDGHDCLSFGCAGLFVYRRCGSTRKFRPQGSSDGAALGATERRPIRRRPVPGDDHGRECRCRIRPPAHDESALERYISNNIAENIHA